jgi:hypothetical protein
MALTRAPTQVPTLQLIEPEGDNIAKWILLWLLQVFGAITAVIFGTFSILAWKIAVKASTQADVANLVAFLSFCSDLPANTGHNMVHQSPVT